MSTTAPASSVSEMSNSTCVASEAVRLRKATLTFRFGFVWLCCSAVHTSTLMGAGASAARADGEIVRADAHVDNATAASRRRVLVMARGSAPGGRLPLRQGA